MTDPTTATTTSSATSTRGASPTAPRLCGGGSGGDAEVVEAWIEGLHVDAQGLVVAVDAGTGGGFASESWAADTGEALVRLVLQQFFDGVVQDVLRKVGNLVEPATPRGLPDETVLVLPQEVHGLRSPVAHFVTAFLVFDTRCTAGAV